MVSARNASAGSGLFATTGKSAKSGRGWETLGSDSEKGAAISDGKEATPMLGFLAAFSYGLASLAMVFINKAVLMRYPHSVFLLVLQQFATAFLLRVGGNFGLCKAMKIEIKTAKKLLPLSLFYNANVAFALASLKGINIPMYIALKRLTPLAVLLTDLVSGKPRPSIQVILSVLTTGVGVIIAAIGDFSFDFLGYSMALLSVFFQTAYLVLVEKSGAEDGMSSTELMFYNSVLCLPFLLLHVVVTKELAVAGSFLLEQMKSVNFLVTVLLSLVLGIILNFTMFFCTIVNSALTTTIVGVLKGVGSTLLGFFLLGGVEVHTLNATGLVVNTFGGIWYSVAKYRQKTKKTRKELALEPLLSKSYNPS